MSDNIKSPLVSVVVITYNSSKYVIETLNSVYNQTYENIELIITDDCSKDNTVDLCNEWINQYKNRFTRTKIITSKTNTGIAANCNRGYKTAKGEWIKGIAGDDIILTNCIENYINYCNKHEDSRIIFSNVETFSNKKFKIEVHPSDKFKEFYYLSPKEQFEVLIHYNQPYAPTMFIKRNLIKEFNYFDEKIQFLEDWPLYIKILKSGYHIAYLDKVTVRYRQEESITRRDQEIISPRFYLSMKIFLNNYLFPIYKERKYYISLLSKKIWLLKYKFAITCLKNKKTRINNHILNLFNIINPDTYLRKIQKNKLKYKFSY